MESVALSVDICVPPTAVPGLFESAGAVLFTEFDASELLVGFGCE